MCVKIPAYQSPRKPEIINFSFWCLMWTKAEVLDLCLNDCMHCPSAIWLADWIIIRCTCVCTYYSGLLITLSWGKTFGTLTPVMSETPPIIKRLISENVGKSDPRDRQWKRNRAKNGFLSELANALGCSWLMKVLIWSEKHLTIEFPSKSCFLYKQAFAASNSNQ